MEIEMRILLKLELTKFIAAKEQVEKWHRPRFI